MKRYHFLREKNDARFWSFLKKKVLNSKKISIILTIDDHDHVQCKAH